jgi:hypothetical protein
MNKCKYYGNIRVLVDRDWLSGNPIYDSQPVCNGTKEQDVCSCGGDRAKCDFYPEVRNKALKEKEQMKAKLLINGKELEVDISEEELKKLETKPAKKTGYERVGDDQTFWHDNGTGAVGSNYVLSDSEIDRTYDAANYYSDFEVAMNNARADKLMRQLRRFAVEHREKELNWLDAHQKKHAISFNPETNMLTIDHWTSSMEFGTMYFDSEETAELAIETFRDELLWYFTEYEDSL